MMMFGGKIVDAQPTSEQQLAGGFCFTNTAPSPHNLAS